MDTYVKTNISKQGYKVQIIKKKMLGNSFEPKVAFKDKVYLERYYKHQPWNVVMDETLANMKAQGLQIIGWMLTKDQQLMKLNLRIDVEPLMVKINAQLEIGKVLEVEQMLKEFKDVSAWTYKYLKGIPQELA
jgi:hypothetical protein